MPDRTLVTREELSAWITGELQKRELCEDCSVSVQYPLREPDPAGVNWSTDVVISLGKQATEKVVREHLGPIVTEARRRFNLS